MINRSNLHFFSLQVGLLKENSAEDSSKESSPFKDILATMERPPDGRMEPKSADYYVRRSMEFN